MILGRMARNEDVPRRRREGMAGRGSAALDRGQVRGLPGNARRRAQQAPTRGAARLQPSQATRLFASRLDQIEAAFHALGRRLVVTSPAG